VIANGAALGGRGGYAGEFGQNRPGIRDHGDRTTTDGTLEDEVSRDRLLAVVGLSSADEATLHHALLGSTDAAVFAELDRQRRVLSVALSNAVNVLNPELIVLGGFLAAVYASDPDGLEALVRAQSVSASFEGVRVTTAALGADLLVIGAAQLPFETLIADPAAFEAPRAKRDADRLRQ
jgi:predicted NBD/HSP70 family sugar kinase